MTYHGSTGPEDQATDVTMAALYHQLDTRDLPTDPPFDTRAGLQQLTERIRRDHPHQPEPSAVRPTPARRDPGLRDPGLREPAAGPPPPRSPVRPGSGPVLTRPASGAILTMVNGVLAGVGGVFIGTHSVVVTVIAALVAITLAVIVLATRR